MKTIAFVIILALACVFVHHCTNPTETRSGKSEFKVVGLLSMDSLDIKCCNNMHDPWTDCLPGEIVGLKCQDGIDHGVTCECCRKAWQVFGPNPPYTIIPVSWLAYCDPKPNNEGQ